MTAAVIPPQPGHGQSDGHGLGKGKSAATVGGEPPKPDPVISAPGTVSLPEIVTGCKVYVERPIEPDHPRRAEVLSIRTKKPTRAERQAEKAARERGEDVPALKDEDKLEYYVHYTEFNKRLDEWIPGRRILLATKEVEWPLAVPPPPSEHGTPARKKTNSGSSTPLSSVGTPGTPSSQQLKRNATDPSLILRKAALKAAASKASGSQSQPTKRASFAPSVADDEDADGESVDDESMMDSPAQAASPAAMDAMDEDAEGELDADGEDDVDETPDGSPAPVFSKAQEIEKLRTQGSMTQSHSEVSRVKNLDRIQMGKHEVEAWYFSPYPVEYAHTPVLYICEFCLSFFASEKMIERHRKKCTLHHPPGNEIYRHEEISFFEIDGRKQKTWCRNLCLLSKCFLDHKTLYYDVDPFMFYVMCARDDTGAHTIGYFSKEKESAENYNVACILTLPQYQRMGYGKLLIEFSYELSKKEGKLGSPEKPLSDLGLLSYRAYWADIIVELLLSTQEDISIDEIANRTAIVHGDVMHTCQVLQMLKFSKNTHHLVISEAVIEQHERQKKKGKKKINPAALQWKPPVFSRQDLRFGY